MYSYVLMMYSSNYEYFVNVLEYKYKYSTRKMARVLSTYEYLELCTRVHEYTSTHVLVPSPDIKAYGQLKDTFDIIGATYIQCVYIIQIYK